MSEREWEPVEPVPLVGAFNGWLSPDGVFYTCAAYEHEMLAWALAERFGYRDHYSGSKALEEHEWIKLKWGMWIAIARELVTQRQLDALFDWATARGESLGDVFMDEERVKPHGGLVAPT